MALQALDVFMAAREQGIHDPQVLRQQLRAIGLSPERTETLLKREGYLPASPTVALAPSGWDNSRARLR